MRKLIVWSIAAALAVPAFAHADIASDHPASILIFPRVVVSSFFAVELATSASTNTDTVIQISNTSTDPVELHCFNVNATGHCSISDLACDPDAGVLCGLPQDICIPRWTETDFHVNLTPRQPIAWTARHGLLRADLPIGGPRTGTGGATNAGTLVPPVRLDPAFSAGVSSLAVYTGELKCIVVDSDGRAVARNVIKGEAQVVTTRVFADSDTGVETEFVSTSKYNGIGVLGIDGDANGDGVLELGGAANEYNGCPNLLIATLFFDQSELPPLPMRPASSRLTLVPCTQNLRSQIPGSTTAQFLVFNEFEQRFSTSAKVDCLLSREVSQIDTRDGNRSIFSVGVAGTIGGQARIRGVNQGLLGILTEQYGTEGIGELSGDDSYNLGMQGDREQADFITVP